MAARPQRAAYKVARVLAHGRDRGLVRHVRLRLSPQTEKGGSGPGRSRYGARDGRETGMDLPLPMKAARHDHDLMQRTAMLADHDGPDLEMPDRLAHRTRPSPPGSLRPRSSRGWRSPSRARSGPDRP